MPDNLATAPTTTAVGRRMLSDNPWVLPVVGVAGVGATFIFAGLIPALIGLIVFLGIAVLALGNTVKHMSSEQVARATPVDESLVSGLIQAGVPTPHQADLERPPSSEQVEDIEIEDESNDSGDIAIREALDGVFDHNVSRTLEATNKYIASADSEDERLRRRAIALWLLTRAGDSDAVEQLRKMVGDHPAEYSPIQYLALALQDLGEHLQAAEAVATNIGSVQSHQAELLILEAEARRSGGDSEGSLITASEAVAVAETDRVKADAHEQCGFALIELGRRLQGLAALEASLRLNPTKYSLRFTIAHHYGEEDLHELAVLHYESLLRHRPTNGSARNNLGVEYQRLRCSLASGDQYRQAANEGSSLAAANLATNLIDAGAREEAERWITLGQEMVTVHPNVFSISAHLASKNGEEQERLDAARKRALVLREVMESASIGSVIPSGVWQLSDGTLYEFIAKGDGEESATNTPDNAPSFGRDGSHLTVIWRQGQYASLRSGVGFSDGDRLVFYVRDPATNETTGFTATRIADEDVGEEGELNWGSAWTD